MRDQISFFLNSYLDWAIGARDYLIRLQRESFEKLLLEEKTEPELLLFLKLDIVAKTLMMAEDVAIFLYASSDKMDNLAENLIAYRPNLPNEVFNNWLQKWTDKEWLEILKYPTDLSAYRPEDASMIERVEVQNIRASRELMYSAKAFWDFYKNIYNKYKHGNLVVPGFQAQLNLDTLPPNALWNIEQFDFALVLSKDKGFESNPLTRVNAVILQDPPLDEFRKLTTMLAIFLKYLIAAIDYELTSSKRLPPVVIYGSNRLNDDEMGKYRQLVLRLWPKPVAKVLQFPSGEHIPVITSSPDLAAVRSGFLKKVTVQDFFKEVIK